MSCRISKQKFVALVLFGLFFGSILMTFFGNNSINTSRSLPNTSAVGDPLVDGQVISATRNVHFSKYLLAEVHDTFTFKNNGSTSLTTFLFCTDVAHNSKLLYITASGLADNTMPVLKKPLLYNGHVTYEVTLLQSLSPGSVEKIKITSVYGNLTKTSGSVNTQYCSFLFNLYPVSPFKILSYMCTITMPKAAKITSYFPDPPVKSQNSGTWSITNVAPFSSLPVTVNFTYNEAPILQMNKLNRRIVIDPWGYINVEEDHVLSNTGFLPVTVYSYKIPINATGFTLRDDLGGIQGSQVSSVINNDGRTKNVSINLNINRARLLGENQFKYTTSYRLPFEMWVSSSWNNYYLFVQTFTSQMDFLILDETTQVILKGGVTLNTITPKPDQITAQKTELIATYTTSMVSPFHNRMVQINFQVNGFWIMLRPIVFLFLILSTVSAYIISRKHTRNKVSTQLLERINIPTKSLQEFVSIYEEKSALLRELDQLNEAVKFKKVAKKEYNKRRSNILAKKWEAEEDLKPLSKVIAEADERFRKSIEKLQFYEVERLSLEDSLKALEARYRRGTIPSRSAYLKLTSDFIKRLEKIQHESDRQLNELKSYIY